VVALAGAVPERRELKVKVEEGDVRRELVCVVVGAVKIELVGVVVGATRREPEVVVVVGVVLPIGVLTI